MAANTSRLLPVSADNSSNNDDDDDTAVPMISATRRIVGDDPAQPDQGGVDNSAGASAADSLILYINNASVNAKLMAAVREGATHVPEIFIEPDKHQCVSNMDLEGGGSEMPMQMKSGSILEAGDLDIPVLDFALLETSSNSKPNLQRTELVAAAAKACQEWGFFQVQNHGIDPALIANCVSVSAATEQSTPKPDRIDAQPAGSNQRTHNPISRKEGPACSTWELSPWISFILF